MTCLCLRMTATKSSTSKVCSSLSNLNCLVEMGGLCPWLRGQDDIRHKHRCCCSSALVWKQCEKCDATLFNILWHKIRFYAVQVTALNRGFLAPNVLSVTCQRKVFRAEQPLNPRLQARAEWCLGRSRARRGPSLKTVEIVVVLD